MKYPQTHRLRQVARNFALVVGGAWATVEIVDFAIEKYGFDPRLLNIVILVAVTISIGVAVLTWYHGEPGRQRIGPIERMILGALTLVTVIVAAYIGTRDPLAEFNSAEGFRLVVEFRKRSPTEPKPETDEFNAELGPGGNYERYFLEDGFYHMNPVDFRLRIPGIRLDGEGLPFRVLHPENGEHSRLTIIVPDMPEDIGQLLGAGPHHNEATIRTSGLGIEITRPFEIFGNSDSALIKILGPQLVQPRSRQDTADQ